MVMRAFPVCWLLLRTAASEAGGAERAGGPLAEYPVDELLALAKSGQVPPIVFPGLADPSAAQNGLAVAPQFSSDLYYTGDIMGIHFKNSVGKFYQDRPHSRHRLTYRRTIDYFRPNATMVQDQLAAASNGAEPAHVTFGEGASGVCLRFGGHTYSDMFAWSGAAEFTNHSSAQTGEPCALWTLDAAHMGFVFTICVAPNGAPLELNQTFVDSSGKFRGFNGLRFFNVVLGPPGEDKFAPTEACAAHFPQKECAPGRRPPFFVELDTYRIQGIYEPAELDDRNTGDVLGDLAFVCTQASSQTYESKLITHWKVKVSPFFGQYAPCVYNGTANRCDGPEQQLRAVGRRSGQMSGVGPRLGQCSANEDVGSQYSWPREAKCPPSAALDRALESGCAWGDARAVRTIEARCLMEERGLLERCRRELGHAPFLGAAELWARAFASDDPARGGCPDAPLV